MGRSPGSLKARIALTVPLLALLGFAVRDSIGRGLTVPELVTAHNQPRGLRVFAEPRDWLMQNAEVSAVVRRRDGALVDFLRQRAILPTAAELGTTTEIDGIWELVPVLVRPGQADLMPRRALVQRGSDAVSVATVLESEQDRVTVQLRYQLQAARPALQIAARFEADRVLPPQVRVGLLVRWGNLSYFVPGNSAPLRSYAGPTTWVGRRGAGGDLLLRALAPSRLIADFSSRAGFQGPLRALIERPAGPQTALTASYELAYEPLPIPPAPPAEVGRIAIRVRDERGRPLPAKATFLPEGDPKRTVFPADGDLSGSERFAWSGSGLILAEPPVGRYRVLVSAGPERALEDRRVSIATKKTVEWEVTLVRLVPTPGWIASDLHLHQAGSVDADLSLDARVIAIAAEGVELAVATDHYVVSDLGPTVRGLMDIGALARPLNTVVGSEVSTLWNRFGHFNVFPLPLQASIEYRDTTPARLFAAARRASPDGVLQVNHPRWEPRLGYFSHFDLHPDTAEPQRPGFDPGFDAVEVYNGEDARDLGRVEAMLHEFLRLLGKGRRYVATGSSDSHKLAFLDPGVPRTLIAHGGASDDDRDVHAPVAEVLRALKSGRAIVTSGPFIDARIGGAGPGQTVRAASARSELHIRVLAPPWISTNRLRVLEGPEARVRFDLPIPNRRNTVRFDRKLRLENAEGTFVVVTVTGDDPLPNTGNDSIRPFAFTNPIWITAK